MSTQQHPPSHDGLLAWRENVQPSPAFRARVWTRIEARRAESFSVFIKKYAFALSCALLMTLTLAVMHGAFSGLRERERMGLESYIASLDTNRVGLIP